MNFEECPHYDEMLKVLSEGRYFEDISFEIDEINNCKKCAETGVCGLWVALAFVENIKLPMNISDAKVTIDTLEEQMKKIVLQLLNDIKKNK